MELPITVRLQHCEVCPGAATAEHANPGSCQQVTVLPGFFTALLQAWLLPRKAWRDERSLSSMAWKAEGKGNTSNF